MKEDFTAVIHIVFSTLGISIHRIMGFLYYFKSLQESFIPEFIVSDSVTPWTVALQAPLPIGFPRWIYFSELICLPPGNLPSPETDPCLFHLLHWQIRSLLVLGVQPQQSPGIPSGWTASVNERMTWRDQASVSEAHKFIFKKSFYTLTCT